jgi:hypothetical protein
MSELYRLTGTGVGFAVLVHVCGCSVLFVNRTPVDGYKPNERQDCTSSIRAPLVDTAAGLLLSTASVAAFASRRHVEDASVQPNVVGGMVLSVPAAIYVASAAYGYIVTHECREAMARAAAKTVEVDFQPPGPSLSEN